MLPFFRAHSKHRDSTHRAGRRRFCVEPLEDRALLATYSVTNLADAGEGSLRQAIIDANSSVEADTIDFTVAGTITLESALPAITDEVDIDGTTATGYTDAPVLEIDFSHFSGLEFDSADGSVLQALALVDAAGAGVALNSSDNMQVTGNYIGVALDGTTAAANSGNGLELNSSSGATITSNVVSGNGGNGIRLSGGGNNTIQENNIGTDATGTVDLGNAASGILLTSGTSTNLIGGEDTGGNDPTNGVYIRPPQGNLISGNDANGVLISGGATENQLSGNFIGTDATGNSALGNTLDGVAIEDADNNSLIGCNFDQNPFVFYNVIDGNGGNGLRVTNADNTTIQANFFGMGADNNTRVGNAKNGVLVEGDSAHTTMGGPIPLGNVDSANGQNGIVVQDTASYFTSYNTFCGIAAFSDATTFGNTLDGMLITSTGGNILIRTNVVSENGDDGIDISGSARDVRVAGNIVGLNTDADLEMGNKDNGIEVSGSAQDIEIGGPQPTFNVIPHNTISANGGNGVAILGGAHNIQVSFSYIGTNIDATTAFGNAGAGVLVASGTYSNVIGSSDQELRNIISGNLGNGIELQDTRDNQVMGSYIGTDITGDVDLGNGANGILISGGSDNVIGAWPALVSQRMFISSKADTAATDTSTANRIAFNAGDGVSVASGDGNEISQNAIYSNGGLGIDLAAGANRNLAAPVLTSVQRTTSNIEVSGTLSAWANSMFVIQFFASDQNDASGKEYLGSRDVTTDASGVATFDFVGSAPSPSAQYITATATDPFNDTSEFSRAIS